MVINTVGQASLAGLCAAFILPGAEASGVEKQGAASYDFHIPAQDLHAALQAVALTSNHKLFHPAKITHGIVSSELNARYTVQQALGALLEGTGLTYEITPSEVILIRKQPEYRPASPTLRSAVAALLAVFAAQAIPLEARAQERTDTLDEIIVTAERRDESAQRSSLSIQVVSEDQLEQVTRPGDLMAAAPGIQISSGGSTPSIFIRGVGSSASNSRGAMGISMNVDGIYFPRAITASPQFFDLDRVEVLKGPQGTLYGRNVTGGAVNLITRRPQLGQFGAYFEGNLGNYNLQSGEGAVNIPLGETLAMRVSGQVIDREGYTSDGGADQQLEAGRARLLWEPNDRISLLLNGGMAHIGGQGSGQVIMHYPDAWRSNTDQPLVYPFQFGPNTLPYTTPNDRSMDADIADLSAELNADLGFATLTVLAANRWHDQFAVYYNTDFRIAEEVDTEQRSIETRLGRSTENYNWVAGVFYYHDQLNVVDNLLQNSRLARLYDNPLTAKAAFGQATISIIPEVRLIGGVRYTEETLSGTYQTGTASLPAIPYTPPAQTPTAFSTKSTRTNWKVGAEYDVADASMLYGSVSTGFRAGGFSPTTACGTLFFEPEDLKAYELGMKNRFLGNTLQVNLEAFSWEYKNQQIGSGQSLDPCGGISSFTRNVGDSTIKGGSIDVVWRATRNDTLRGYVEYADGKYDNFSFTQFGAGAYTPGQGSLCPVTPTGNGFLRVDCSGQPSIRLPKWIAQAGYEHVFDLAGAGTVTPSLNWQYAAKNWLDLSYTPNTLADDYDLFSARVTYDSAGGKWSLTAYIDNAFDSKVYTSASTIAAIDTASGTRLAIGSIEPPRMYGLRARVNF